MTTVKMSGLGYILKKRKKNTFDRAWGDNKYRYWNKVIYYLDFEIYEKIDSHTDSRVRSVLKVRPTRYFYICVKRNLKIKETAKLQLPVRYDVLFNK